MRTWYGCLLLLCLPFLAAAQGKDATETPASGPVAAATRVTFAFDPGAMGGRPYEITVAPDGHGSLRYLRGDQGTTRDVTVSAPTMALLTKPVLTVSSGHCETRQKHVAQTGRKTVSYTLGPDQATCSFNFSDDQDLNTAASAFLAIQQTIALGDELARLHRFDRLGLDAQMDALQNALKSHLALEVGNIAPELQSIANDDRVMERVRRKAARLLDDAGLPAKADS